MQLCSIRSPPLHQIIHEISHRSRGLLLWEVEEEAVETAAGEPIAETAEEQLIRSGLGTAAG